jgi:hypothetical protein
MFIGFQVFTVGDMKSSIFKVLMPFIPLKTDVSEEHVASIFKQETSVKKMASRATDWRFPRVFLLVRKAVLL